MQWQRGIARIITGLLAAGILLGAIDRDNRWALVAARLAWPQLRTPAASDGPDLDSIDALATRLARRPGPMLLVLDRSPFDEAQVTLLYRLRRDLYPLVLDAACRRPGSAANRAAPQTPSPPGAGPAAPPSPLSTTAIRSEPGVPSPAGADGLELIDLDYRRYAGRPVPDWPFVAYGTLIVVGAARDLVPAVEYGQVASIPGLGPVVIVGSDMWSGRHAVGAGPGELPGRHDGHDDHAGPGALHG